MKIKKIFTVISVFLCVSSTFANPVSSPEKEKFRFFINADPQMGPENTDKNGLKILNELLENFVTEVNQKNEKTPIDFVLFNGDLVWDPYQDAFDNFTRIVAKQEVPTMLVHGNHDGYNDDPKFFQAQKKLSGYEKLNYSFDYGKWHFVVVGAQEKYLKQEQKDKQLAWLKKELTDHKDKQVMLFMHYHIMPVGLSQMEFYTYWPIEFKNQMLDTITEHGNVKYAFTGHVHVGVKASIKSSLEYKGTKFINSPTPVMARPFGEEFAEFEDQPKDRYFRRGFYLEVKVDGNEVEMIGHKIQHQHVARYPQNFKKFKINMDKRFFKPESETKPNKKIRNPSFNKGFKGWKKSYRYKKGKNNSFKNVVKNGSNIMQLNAPWGSWSFDEYMETYQIVELDLTKKNVLSYEFQKPKYSKKGAGGYIKLSFYDDKNQRNKMLLLHWGHKEERVKLMYQSWFFNSEGDRGGSGQFEKAIKNKDIVSIPVEFDKSSNQVLDIDLNQFLKKVKTDESQNKINKISISHGVWTRILQHESKINSSLTVNGVDIVEKTFPSDKVIMLNNSNVPMIGDSTMPYFNFNK